jgi:hypothetical protein
LDFLGGTQLASKRKCPACKEMKEFRKDAKTCGCRGTNPRLNVPDLKETNEIQGDKWTVVLPKTRIHTLEELLEFCEVDLSIWEVERFVCNKWEMNAGEGRVEPLYQVKAFLKKRKTIIAIKDEIESLKELAKKNSIKPPNVRVAVGLGVSKMLQINLTDHHFGKMSWGAETGFANYDVKIATAVWNRAISTLLDRASNYDYEEIWFIVGNDLFNSDDTQSRTTMGTQVESDVRHEKTYRLVREILVNTIEEFRKHVKKVKVIVVPGNHDHNATWHMGDSLECYFSKYSDVEIDNRPLTRKYHTFGDVLLGFTHGDHEKRTDLPMLMATEVAELFGKSKFREWHTGHNHNETTVEKNGIVVRILSALYPADAWHAEKGYVGNRRSSQAFQWDKKEGLVGTVVYIDSDDKIEK